MMAEAVAIQASGNPMKKVLGIRDFMLLWLGQGTSMLGDQFYSIAGAWMVLKMTGDPMALGIVMALGGIPRAIFTVLGGAITDRISPRRLMLISDVVRLAVSALLAAQLFTGTLQVWMIYVYSIVNGIMGGLFGPASMSIVPHVVPEEDLQAGNSLSQGSSSLIGFVGPAIAGGMIALFSNQTTGMAIAIAFDALTFVVSVVTLWMMKSRDVVKTGQGRTEAGNIYQSVKEGFKFIVKDPVLRMMFIMIALANLCFTGPLLVGIPYLADTRFSGGAAAYGIIISGYAGGNLLGIIISGFLPKLAKRLVRPFMVIMFTLFGLGIIAMSWISITWVATADLFILGILNGYLSIMLITGLQRSTPKDLLGRLMSMILLANLSMMPLSQALSGYALRWSVLAVFGTAGLILVGLATVMAFSKTVDSLSDKLVGTNVQ
jgi:MFS family permease